MITMAQIVEGTDGKGTADLVDEAPGDADALLDVSDDAVARLEAGVVVEGRPDLSANLLETRIQY